MSLKPNRKHTNDHTFNNQNSVSDSMGERGWNGHGLEETRDSSCSRVDAIQVEY